MFKNNLKTNSIDLNLPWEIIDQILIFLRNPDTAIGLCRFEIVDRIRKQPSLYWSIESGHVSYLKYLVTKSILSDLDRNTYEKSLLKAVGNSNLTMTKYCHDYIQSTTSLPSIIECVARYGHVRLVKYLHFIGSTSSHLAMDYAAANGHLKILIWLHTNRIEGCSPTSLDWAASNGHVTVVQWLDENTK